MAGCACAPLCSIDATILACAVCPSSLQGAPQLRPHLPPSPRLPQQTAEIKAALDSCGDAAGAAAARHEPGRKEFGAGLLAKQGSLARQASFGRLGSFGAGGGRRASLNGGGLGGAPGSPSAPDVKVEAQPCLLCTAGDAVPDAASWANPALSCALFFADVRSLASARRAQADSANVSLARRLQRASPAASGNNRSGVSAGASTVHQSAADHLANMSRHGGPSDLPRRTPSELRWGAPVAPMDSARVAPLVDGSRRELLAFAERRPTAAQGAAAAVSSLARVQSSGGRPPGGAGPDTVSGARMLLGAAPVAPAPQLQFRLEPLGRSPSPIPRG